MMPQLNTQLLSVSLGLLLASASAGCVSAGAVEGRQQPGQWRSLFDGKTLTGWTPKIVGFPAGQDPLQTFRVRDGAIAVSYDMYGGKLANRFGHLFYKEPFKSYRLSLDYRFTGEQVPNDPPPGTPVNSGVMYNSEAPELMALDQFFPISIEAQILGAYPAGPPRTTANVCGMGINLFSTDRQLDRCNSSQEPVRPNGTWVHFELEVTNGGNATESIDGKPTVHFDRAEYDPTYTRFPIQHVIAAAGGKLLVSGGYIALQSEGHPIEFRNIRIMSTD